MWENNGSQEGLETSYNFRIPTNEERIGTESWRVLEAVKTLGLVEILTKIKIIRS